MPVRTASLVAMDIRIHEEPTLTRDIRAYITERNGARAFIASEEFKQACRGASHVNDSAEGVNPMRLHDLCRRRARMAICAAVCCFSAATADASQPAVSLNYESLSSLEEPLAVKLGDVTLLTTALLDFPYTIDLDGESPYSGTGALALFQLSAKTQLPNRWRADLTWFAQYADDAPSVKDPQEDYADRVALSVGGSCGRVSVGNVSGAVLLQTRRLRGAGPATARGSDHKERNVHA